MPITALPQHQLLSRIVWMRSISVIAQLLMVMAGYFWADIDLPLTPLLTVIGALAVFNGWTWRRMRCARPVSEAGLFFQLFIDVTALSSLLYFSGGATNPFVSFYLPALAVIAGELRHDAHSNPALAAYSDDLIAIETQIAICKTALDRIGGEAAAADAKVCLSAWLRRFSDNWRLRYPATTLLVSVPDSDVQAAHSAVLGQILLTLLDNAAQAIAGRQTAGQIRLALLLAPDNATLRVSDNGAGIAAPLLKRLGREAVASSSGGRGIGLMLAFANAHQIDAGIALTSVPGQGSVAELTIAI